MQGELEMNNAYTHGCHDCALCFHKGGKQITYNNQWRLTNWPAYWGASNPDTLVLGFSMGATQIRAATDGQTHFDKVAFAGMRINLSKILGRFGFNMKNGSIDEAITARGTSLGFSSLSRCGLEKWEKGRWVTSGTIMGDAARDPWSKEVLARCAATHLVAMPPSVRRVILLGNSQTYMDGVRQLLRPLFQDFKDLNQVAFTAGGRTWVFVCHPKAQGARVEQWLTDPTTTSSGSKRDLAMDAIAMSQVQELLEAANDDPPTVRRGIGVKRLVKANGTILH